MIKITFYEAELEYILFSLAVAISCYEDNYSDDELIYCRDYIEIKKLRKTLVKKYKGGDSYD